MESPQIMPEGKKFKFDLRLIEVDPDEKVICEIRKHPIGLIFIILSGLFVSGVVLAAGILLDIWVNNDSSLGINGSQSDAFVIGSVILAVFCAIITLIAGFLYTSNVILLTSEKIAQVVYRSIFSKKVSQLSIGDVQDVTIDQHGLLAHFFNYGTIVIETAGEQQNYTFHMVPDPYLSAKQIVSAHEENMKLHGN